MRRVDPAVLERREDALYPIQEMLGTQGWVTAKGELCRRIRLIEQSLRTKRFETLAEVAHLQGQALVLQAILDDPEEFFRPVSQK